MFDISVGSVIQQLRETLLGRDSWKVNAEGYQKGLIVSVDLRLYEDPGSENERSALVHFLFTANTSVFVGVSEKWVDWYDVPWGKWKNTSNHDSCWRTDGVDSEISRLYFRWAKEINSKIAPKDMFQFCSFKMGTPWEFVMVRHERESDDHHGYKRRVVDLKPFHP